MPYRYTGQQVKIHKTNEGILEIYDEHERIVMHPVVDDKHQMTMNSE